MPQMWGRFGESRFILLDGLRMKRLPLYFNKGVTLLVLLAMQMEAFAQRGRFIPQDWGGGSSSHGSGFGEDLFVYLVVAVILVCYIIFKIQSFNAKGKESAKANPKSTSNPSVSSNGNSVSHTTNNECKTNNIDDTTQKKVNRFANDFDEQMYYERIACGKKLFNGGKSSKDDTWFLRRYGLTAHEYKQSLKDNQQKGNEVLSKLYLNRKYIKIPNGKEEILYYYIEQSKAKVVELPKSIEKLDGVLLNKFEVVIIPHEEKSIYENLLALYKGKVVDDTYDGNVWVGSEMTLSAYVALHGDCELRLIDNSHYLMAKDGTCACFMQELESVYNQTKELDKRFLKVREYFSMNDKKFHFGAYNLSKPDENYHCHGFI